MPAGTAWREAWGHSLHSKCPRAAASIPVSWWAQAEGACPASLDLCRQGTATATCSFRGLSSWYFEQMQEWQGIRYNPGQKEETQTWKWGSQGELLVGDYLHSPPGFLSAAERSKVCFCGKYWCPSWELPIHSGCLGSSKNLGSSVLRESTLGFTGGGFSNLGLNGQKLKKNGECVTQSLKLLRFCGINIIFNVEGMFSWAVHVWRSSHMSSFTTSLMLCSVIRINLCSDETHYTNTAYIKYIVREDNPVTGFTIKERSNRNIKTTL